MLVNRLWAGVLFIIFPARAALGLEMPSEWDFGSLAKPEVLTHSFTIHSTEKTTLSVRILSSCECLAVKPDRFELGPGKSATIRITLDLSGHAGEVNKLLLVQVINVTGMDRLYTVMGRVGARAAWNGSVTPEGSIAPGGSASPGKILPVPAYDECEWCRKLSQELRRKVYESWRSREGVVHYYYSPDCISCSRFLESEIPRLQKLLARTVDVDRLDINEPWVLDELTGILDKRKVRLAAFPVLIIGEKVLQGEKEIRAGLEPALRAGSSQSR